MTDDDPELVEEWDVSHDPNLDLRRFPQDREARLSAETLAEWRARLCAGLRDRRDDDEP